MSEFDGLLDRIRQAAREMAEYRLSAAEKNAGVSAGFFREYPSFSEAQRSKFIEESENEAVRRIYAHLHDIAIKSQ